MGGFYDRLFRGNDKSEPREFFIEFLRQDTRSVTGASDQARPTYCSVIRCRRSLTMRVRFRKTLEAMRG
jgi:hypothetical protein